MILFLTEGYLTDSVSETKFLPTGQNVETVVLLGREIKQIHSILIPTAHNEPVVIPSMAELQSFDSIVQPIFSQIRNLRSENDRLANIRDTLLPRLMSGELDVSDVAIWAAKLSFSAQKNNSEMTS